MTKSISMNRIGGTLLFLMLTTFNSVAQTLTDFNDALQKQKTPMIEILDTILWFVVIIAFVLMVINIFSKTVDQKMAVVSFVVILVLRGLFTLFS